MKRTTMMTVIAALACAAQGIETKCLDGLWDFAFAEGQSLAEAACDFTATDRMPVPDCFDLVPGYYMKRGTGQYRRVFTLERGVPGARLRVKGMGLRMKLWLDGREIGTSKLVFSDLEFQTGPLAAGRHTLVAALDNRLFAAPDEMFQPYYDYVASGGFYHGVELRLQSLPVEIDRVLVRNRDYKTGRVELELCVRNAADGSSAAEAVREAQVSFDGGAPRTVRFTNGRAEMNVPEFRLWSPEAPHLHSVRVAAEGFGAAEARFGVRQFTCAKGKFWLNGNPVFLKGVNRHDSDYANGYATSRISMWRDLKLIKGLGANFVRTSHYPPSDEFLSLCDEMGLLVWQECTGWQNNPAQMSNPEFIALQLEQAHLMARGTINHPSAVIDAFLNEFKSTSKEGRALAEKMVDALHAEDTGRPVSYATCRYVNEIANDKTDFIAFNLYPAWHQEMGTATTHESLSETVRRRFREVTQIYRDRFGPDKPIMIGETGCYSFYGQHDSEGAQWTEEFQAEYLSNSVDFAIKDDDIQGVAVWQFCDSRSYFRGGADIRTRPLGRNMAGLYDIHRREKLAAKAVRKLFKGERPREPQIREGERPREPQANVVRIMSYNVRHCRGADNKVDVKRVADRIKAENPDFACLNEIKPPQALELGKKAGMFATPCGMRSCNAILSRKPPIRIEEVALPWNYYGPRSLMVCEFPEFAVAVMHYDCSEKALQCRIDSAAVVRDTIARYGKPVFVAGDWNAEPHTEPIAALRGCVKILSEEKTRTWHGFGKHKTLQPGKTEYCIDYISVDAKSADRVTLIETHVVKDDVTSDHYPVVATLRLAAEPQIREGERPRESLRLATYNIHQGMGKFDKKFKYAIREQLDYLEWEKLDVFGLNEVNWHIERSGMADAPADIAALTGRHVEYAAARSVGKGNYGNAVVSKEKPISTLRVDLPRGNGQKGLKCSLMLCEFKDFWFGSTHLEVRSAITNQLKSVEILRKVVTEKSKTKPVFLSGDWNNEPDSITLAKMGEFMTILNDPKERTYNGFSEKPKDDERCIDYIAVDNAHAHLFTVVERRVKGSSFASDHNPVFVTLEKRR